MTRNLDFLNRKRKFVIDYVLDSYNFNALSIYQVLQKEQQQKITVLEKKLTEMRVKHNDAVQRLKAKFLEDKNAFEEESETQLKELSKEAKKV